MFNITKISYRGFTLIEVIVSLFVFLIIMLALSSTFAQSFTGYRNTRAVQRDVESAQFALNLMAKALRTSTIVSADAPAPTGTKTVKFYDYSQKMCFEYKIDDSNDELTVAKTGVVNQALYLDPPAHPGDPLDPSTFHPEWACSLESFSFKTPLVKIENTGGDLTGKFVVKKSTKSPASLSLGKITVSLHISEGPRSQADVQTTSSLRDYGYVGLIGD